MSSILDALERAARERGQGKMDIPPPTLSPAGETQSPLRRVLLLIVIVIGGVAAFWFLSPDWAYQPDTGPTGNGRMAKTVEQPEAASNPERDPGQVQAPESKPIRPRGMSIGERIRKSSQPNQRPLASEAMLSEGHRSETLPEIPGPETAAERPARERSRGEEIAGPAPDEPGEKTATATQPSGEISGEEAVVQNSRPLAPPALSGPEEPTDGEQVEQQQIPLIWELDQGLREELEQLQISIHVYHRIPSQRFVIIDMRRYAEGDSLGANGYRLHAIDKDGIIVDHGSGLVRLLRER